MESFAVGSITAHESNVVAVSTELRVCMYRKPLNEKKNDKTIRIILTLSRKPIFKRDKFVNSSEQRLFNVQENSYF